MSKPQKSSFNFTKQTEDAEPFKLTNIPKLFLTPEEAIKEADIKTGQTVADLGSGAGFITIPAAKIVGPQGLVYAVDILKDSLQSLRGQAKLFNLANISYVWADLEKRGSTKIPDNSVDTTFLFKVLCQQKKHHDIIQEAQRITKPGGIIMLAEWCEPINELGQPNINLIDYSEVKKITDSMGLKIIKEQRLDKNHFVLKYKRS